MSRLLLSLVPFLVVEANAQTSFVRTYALPTNTYLLGSDAAPDGGLFVCGTVDYVQGFLSRLDVAGNVLWTRTYTSIGTSGSGIFPSPFQATVFHGVLALSDSAVIVCGSGTNAMDQDYLVAKLDGGGNVVWANSTGNGWGQQFTSVENGGGSSVVTVGWTGSITTPKATIARLNMNEGGYMAYCESSMGQVGITGRTAVFSDGSVLVSAETMNGTFLMKLDSSFAQLWARKWSNFHASASAGLPDGSMMCIRDSTIVRLFADGATDWSQQLLLGNGSITDLAVRQDGKILLCGWAGTPVHAWSAVLDTMGNVLASNRYGNDGDDFRGMRIAVLDNGDVRVAGPVLGGAGLFIVGADQDGALQGCAYPSFTLSTIPYALLPIMDTVYSNLAAGFPGDSLVPIGSPAYLASYTGCGAAGALSASGIVFGDADLDGTMDLGDPAFLFGGLSIQPDNGFTFTNAMGAFDFRPPVAGTHTIAFTSTSPWWTLTTDSASYTVAFTPTDTVFADLDFGFAPSIDTTVLVGSFVCGTGPCGAVVQQTISLLNNGTTTPQGVVALTLDPLFTFTGSNPAPDSIVGNTLYWSYDSLGWYQIWQQALTVQLPDASHIGEAMQNTILVWRDDGMGQLILSDAVEWNQLVSCAYDPNDKQVIPQGDGAQGAIPFDTQWLTYTIRFQNTGTDTAYTVVVEDLLSQHLDRRSVQVLGSSHTLTGLDMSSGGLASFRFDNILLPDSNVNALASQGFITFRVRPYTGLEHLTEIANNGGIFFDLNLPVITNTVRNTIVDCSQSQWTVSLFDQGGGWLVAVTTFMDTMTYSYQWLLDGTPIPGATTYDWNALESGDYSAALTDAYGCTVISDQVTVIVSNVPEPSRLSIGVAPNPFNDGARLVFTRSLVANALVEVVDLNGHTLRTIPSNSTRELRIERGDLSPGLYVVRVSDPMGTYAACRVVVQ